LLFKLTDRAYLCFALRMAKRYTGLKSSGEAYITLSGNEKAICFQEDAYSRTTEWSVGMKPRERVIAALQHREPDRVPNFEIWINPSLGIQGQADPVNAYANLGQDCVMMPVNNPPESNAWRDGVDEWGRVWRNGIFVDGAVDSLTDLEKYSPPLNYVEQLFDGERIRKIRNTFPDHCLIFGKHIGPFTAGYLAMGFERFFLRLEDDPRFVQQLLEARTEWCIAMYQKAVSLGAEVLVLGEDAGHGGGPMISPRMWRRFILPLHRRIVAAMDVPMIWHSDGDIEALLPLAIEAGFVGIHGVDSMAGMDLARVKQENGQALVLIGNVDARLLFASDFEAVRGEVDRCMAQAAPGGGYMIASCNSICEGMNTSTVAEMFRYAREVGDY
jgi:uroporphyrinogen decarboxylase